ncbi:MAG: hypothetical protein WBE37_10090, partial [Bryobacteraceae bacterium]
SCHPAGVRTLRSAGTSRSLPGRRELISENRLATQGKIATRYTIVASGKTPLRDQTVDVLALRHQ